MSLYTQFSSAFVLFFFFLYVISISFVSRFRYAPPLSLSITEFCTSPLGNCPSFLAPPTFTARAARRYDRPNKAIRTIPFFSLLPLVGMSPTFLPCITVDFAALTSLASESSTALSAGDLYLVRFASFAPGVRFFAMLQLYPLSPRCVPTLPPFF